MMPSNPKKRQRIAHPRSPITAAVTGSHRKLRRTSSQPLLFPSPLLPLPLPSLTSATYFNDSTTADVILRLFLDSTALLADPGDVISSINDPSDVQIYLHSHVLCRTKYFAALLSDRWQCGSTDGVSESSNCKNLISLKLGVPPKDGAIDVHLAVLELLYTDDFSNVIDSASTALDILPVALELLFEDCVKNCVKFLEAVPWNEEEEKRVLSLIPFLREEESEELLARVSPAKDDPCEEMLQGLITSAMRSHHNMAIVKAFVAKLLKDFTSKESSRRVLESAFETSLKIVKQSLEEYSSPDFRGDHNETEAIQRRNLHIALTNGRHLLWLVERMIELRVADNAVKEWSDQPGFTADLQRAFKDEACRNIVPGLPVVVIRCTSKLANAVAAGTIVAARQVRMKLVKHWLPVLIVCKDYSSSILPVHKALYLELEETILRIISTLPMSDAQELLQQCLSFSTRNVEDCPHLITAFNTWFRRATRPPPGDNLC